MNLKLVLVLLIITGIVSAGITKYYFPKVEIKSVEVTKEVIKNDIKTIVKTIIKPDGTKEIIAETTDKSTKQESIVKETIISKKNDWMFNAGTRINPPDLSLTYELIIQRRITGPFFIGAQVGTDKIIGLTIGLEF